MIGSNFKFKYMKRKNVSLWLLTSAILFSSCASIVSKGVYPISINSTPSGANISVITSDGTELYKGNTPAVVNLKAGDGFFKRATYQVKFSKAGYDERIVPINFKVDGWYWGNIIFGGAIGMLIVDPATGAMYKLETEYLNETLTQTGTTQNEQELKIYGLDDIPAEWKEHLVRMSK